MPAVLYSFRRCPFAIRARFTLALLERNVALREVVLKNKPQALLDLGGRSSVPQLIDGGNRYPESLDIMLWAVEESENHSLKKALWPKSFKQRAKVLTWLSFNDHCFKPWLDRYKYADRYPAQPADYYREKGERFLKRLDNRLSRSSFLVGEEMTLADIGVFPFIRQFAGVDYAWFESSDYPHLKHWLAQFLESDLFGDVMKKFAPWSPEQEAVYFP